MFADSFSVVHCVAWGFDSTVFLLKRWPCDIFDFYRATLCDRGVCGDPLTVRLSVKSPAFSSFISSRYTGMSVFRPAMKTSDGRVLLESAEKAQACPQCYWHTDDTDRLEITVCTRTGILNSFNSPVTALVCFMQCVVCGLQTSQTSVRTSSMVSGQHVVPGRGRSCSNAMEVWYVVDHFSMTDGSWLQHTVSSTYSDFILLTYS